MVSLITTQALPDRPDQSIGIVCLALATLDNVPDLAALEATAFAAPAYDDQRIKPRQFRYLLRQGHADLGIAQQQDGGLLGYALLLYRNTSLTARLYSLAVTPSAQGSGLGALLVAYAETLAQQRDRHCMGLEALADNTALIRFYQRLGYTGVRPLPDYYAGQHAGLRLEKALTPRVTTAP